MLAGLILSQSDCDSPAPMANNDLAGAADMATTMVPPDMTVLPDMTMFAAPTVTGVSPSAGANNTTTALVITGTGFRAGATVTVGGQPCANVTVTSATSLSCTAPARAGFCGAQDIVVTHPDDGKRGTGSKIFRYRSSTFAFAATSTTTTVSTGPNEILAVDLNNDGKPDLVNTNRSGNAVTAMLGGGDGTFMATKTANTGTNPVGLAAGDLDGDSKLDLAVTSQQNNLVSVYSGNGNGTFAAAPMTTPVGTNPIGIAAVDVDGDGKLDLFTANFASANATLLLGKGNGTFNMATGSPFTVGTQPFGVVLADLNNDGQPDYATANSGSANVTSRIQTCQ
jgi:hypothetical protein